MTDEPRVLAHATLPNGEHSSIVEAALPNGNVLVTCAHQYPDGECWFTFHEYRP